MSRGRHVMGRDTFDMAMDSLGTTIEDRPDTISPVTVDETEEWDGSPRPATTHMAWGQL